MNKKFILYSVVILCFCFLFFCKNEGAKYKIIEKKPSVDNKAFYILAFASDTNWKSMEAFAQKQIDTSNPQSIIAFYYPESKVPHFDTINDEIIGDSLKYTIAIYKNENSNGKYYLFKIVNRYNNLIHQLDGQSKHK